MRFSKYHGIGNDFVMLADPRDEIVLTPELARRLCDRRFGIGADGVIRVGSGRDGASVFMDYLNADGSIGEMCGNGIRCLALFARAEGLTDATELAVATRAGTKVVRVLEDGRVRVDMGAPVFDPADVPVRATGRDALSTKLELPGEIVEAACLSMGNPHAVLFVDDPGSAPVTTLGPVVENHGAFPHKTNVEFVKVVDERRIEMRVWERGVGETLACGTGACAAAVAARLLAGAADTLVVGLPGGELEVAWTGSRDAEAPVFLTGPAVESFTGAVDPGALA
jgi:diaminopimelate epimerase